MNTRIIVQALVEFDGKFLIAKRAPTKKYGAGKWELISGNVDTGESAEDIILRELKEETGLTGEIVKTGVVFELIDENVRWVALPFLIRAASNNVILHTEDHSEICWVASNELDNYTDLTELPYLRKAGLF